MRSEKRGAISVERLRLARLTGDPNLIAETEGTGRNAALS
jgi:hypothetical protein